MKGVKYGRSVRDDENRLTAAEVLSRAKDVTGGCAFRGRTTSAGFAVLAASTLTVDHGTIVSTLNKVRENYVKCRLSRNTPRITTPSALTAGLTRRATRVSFTTGIAVRTTSSVITVVAGFAASYS